MLYLYQSTDKRGEIMISGSIETKRQLIELVNDIGFLPFFSNSIPGFSLEEIIDPSCWWQGGQSGKFNWPAWDWKGEILRSRQLVYGKFFSGKAGFISLEWWPTFCNYRRDGYDFDSRVDEGLVFYKDREIMDCLFANGASLSKTLKRSGNYKKGGNTGFETIMTRLQMQTYVTPIDFEYMVSKKTGEEYGWGVARYDVSDRYWGEELCRSKYSEAPETSFEHILARASEICPEADNRQLKNLIK